ncbi:MAG: hypothetical protein CMH58_03950 [Myxococcales bacterium]|nr:hypothetical protein [Myxococcales bacterium]|tara:strand:- start:5068 stop:5496 length:429 start_codon:yes stop_codon:yes gene_type:complete
MASQLSFTIYLKHLPDDVLTCIYGYIPPIALCPLNKTLYINNRYSIRSNIPVFKYEGYIRQIIRQDNDFVFNHLINDNYLRWQNIKKYKWKEMIFDDYVEYIMYFAREHRASKCLTIVFDKKNQEGKKRHKNTRIRSNTWSN